MTSGRIKTKLSLRKKKKIIEEEYIQGKMSLREIARKYDINVGTLWKVKQRYFGGINNFYKKTAIY